MVEKQDSVNISLDRFLFFFFFFLLICLLSGLFAADVRSLGICSLFLLWYTLTFSISAVISCGNVYVRV